MKLASWNWMSYTHQHNSWLPLFPGKQWKGRTEPLADALLNTYCIAIEIRRHQGYLENHRFSLRPEIKSRNQKETEAVGLEKKVPQNWSIVSVRLYSLEEWASIWNPELLLRILSVLHFQEPWPFYTPMKPGL